MSIFSRGKPFAVTGVPHVDLARIKLTTEFLDQFVWQNDHKSADVSAKVIEIVNQSVKRALNE